MKGVNRSENVIGLIEIAMIDHASDILHREDRLAIRERESAMVDPQLWSRASKF